MKESIDSIVSLATPSVEIAGWIELIYLGIVSPQEETNSDGFYKYRNLPRKSLMLNLRNIEKFCDNDIYIVWEEKTGFPLVLRGVINGELRKISSQ